MVPNLFELDETLQKFESQIQALYKKISECESNEDLKNVLALIDAQNQSLIKLTYSTVNSLPNLNDDEKKAAFPHIYRIKSLLESNLKLAAEQKELAKKAILNLKQTAAGVEAYSSIKKQF